MKSSTHAWLGLWALVIAGGATAAAPHATDWDPPVDRHPAAADRLVDRRTAPKTAVLTPRQIAAALAAIRERARGNVLIVDCHGNYDYATIQGAIDAAADGDTIVVLPNNCTPQHAYLERIDFLGKGITVQSLLPEDPAVVANTVIDGTQNGVVVTLEGNPQMERALNGLTIRNGSAADGGGIYSASPRTTVANCVIAGNSASNRGGGMYATVRVTLNNCTFRQNSADVGGGLHAHFGYATLTNCTFVENVAGHYGGGLDNNAAGSTLTQCTFIGNSAAQSGGAVRNSSYGDLSLTNCLFSANTAGDIGGGLCTAESTTSLELTGCAFVGNSAAHYGGAVGGVDHAPSQLNNCTLVGNSATAGGAVYVYLSAHTQLGSCVLWDNTPSEILVNSGQITVTYSDVRGGWSGTGNIDTDPLLAAPGDYHLTADSRCINAGDPSFVPPADGTDPDGDPRVVAGIVDMGADEATVFTDCNLNNSPDWKDIADGVSQDTNNSGIPDECEATRLYVNAFATGGNDGASWADAYRELRDALSGLLPNIREIWVAAGAYKPAGPSGDRAASLTLRDGLAVYGGFAGWETELTQRDPAANVTLLSGDLNADDGPDFMHNEENSLHVVTLPGSDNAATLDGFTIAGGNANGSEYHAYEGGGIRGNGVAVRNCVLVRNWASSGAGAAGSGTFERCQFVENTAAYSGGGAAVSGAAGGGPSLFQECEFVGNVAGGSDGGGVCTDSGHLTLSRCRFVGNYANGSGGGVCTSYESKGLTASNCEFRNNWAGRGGGLYNGAYYNASSEIRNCIFAENVSTSHGAGLYVASQIPPIIINCAFYWNSAAGQGGGIYNFCYGKPQVTNCIVWDNLGGEIVGPYPIMVTYSDVAGGFNGIGNISANPRFAEPWNGNFHLMPDSPCIDAGDPNFVPLPSETDLDRQARVWDGNGDGTPIVDMGVDEYGSFVFGDMNCDGAVNAFDIDPFVLALTDADRYAAQYPHCDRNLADCSADGRVDVYDIDPFVALLVRQ